MADETTKNLYHCLVMSGNPFQPLSLANPFATNKALTSTFNVEEKISFYVMTDVNFRNPQSINIKLSPYTAAGKTQNLGRKEISFTANMTLVNEKNGTTKEAKLNQLFLAKNNGKILKVTVPGLPLGNNNYYISDMNWNVKDPSRIIATVSFVEVLESSLQINTQNLVMANSLQNLQTLLKQLGLI